MNALMMFALLSVGVGLALFAHGLMRWVRGGRGKGTTPRVLWMIQGFRIGIVGLALVGLGIGVMTDQTWVVILSLAIAGEEILESSIMIAALRTEQRR